MLRSNFSSITALVISNAVMFVVGVMILWCSFDVAGRDWVKLKKYQKSLKNQGWKGFSILSFMLI